MTFEEFFKKKRIDLDALEKGDPALFSEFKTHYHQMGEKSFDHTKKYWFNKIRRQYQLAAEIKTEKPKIENQLAEQTVIEALIEEGTPLTTPAPKLGFVPKFKAGNIPKPPTEEKAAAAPATPAPKLGFMPKFKAANMPKPATEENPQADEPAAPAPKLGFVPKFKAANMPKPATEEKPQADESAAPAPKLGFKPKFKAANMPKPVTEEESEADEPTKDIPSDPSAENKPPQPYKPRFNMKNIPPKPPEE